MEILIGKCKRKVAEKSLGLKCKVLGDGEQKRYLGVMNSIQKEEGTDLGQRSKDGSEKSGHGISGIS